MYRGMFKILFSILVRAFLFFFINYRNFNEKHSKKNERSCVLKTE